MEPGTTLFILILLGLVAALAWIAWCTLVGGAIVWGTLKLFGQLDN